MTSIRKKSKSRTKLGLFGNCPSQRATVSLRLQDNGLQPATLVIPLQGTYTCRAEKLCVAGEYRAASR